MKYQKKALKIQALMGFKPTTRYFTASEISEKKAYQIIKRANGLSKEKAYNILALMGFKPMNFKTKYFPAYAISKEKTLKIQALMGFKPMTNIFQLPKCERRKPMKY